MKIVLDTSSILFAYENKIDPFELLKESGYKPIISKGILDELKRIADSKSKKSGYAKIALKEIKEKDIEIDESKEYPDLWILKKGIKACTNDKELKNKLKKKGIPVISIAIGGKLR
jgi:rRNA-processing protein FCF1